jgi:hypothetical protein
MFKIFVLAAASAALSGCAGASYAINEYSGVDVVSFQMPEDTYRVYDKPSQNKLMITPSIGAAALQGAGNGLLLNSVDNTPPKPMFERAAAEYLRSTGRQNCRIVDSYIILKPQYEVKYDCTPILAQAVPPLKRR